MSHPNVILTDPVLSILLVLATARLTRLVAVDTIFDPVRLTLSRYDWSAELVHCPWCVGAWISLAMVLLTLTFADSTAWIVALLVLSVSHLTGLLADP